MEEKQISERKEQNVIQEQRETEEKKNYLWKDYSNQHILRAAEEKATGKKNVVDKEILAMLEEAQKKVGVKEYEAWALNKEKLKRDRIQRLTKDSKWYGKDSPEMKAVKTAVNNIAVKLDTKIEKRDDPFEVFWGARKAYSKAIDACQTYLDNKQPIFAAGKRRKARVQEIKDQLEKELKRYLAGWGIFGEHNIEINKGTEKAKRQEEGNFEITTPRDLLELEISYKQYELDNMNMFKSSLERQKEQYESIKEMGYIKAARLTTRERGANSIMNELAEAEKKHKGYTDAVKESIDRRMILESRAAEKCLIIKKDEKKSEIQKYYDNLSELAKQADAIEQEQYEIIKKASGEAAADEWLSHMDKEREEQEKLIMDKRKQYLSPEEYMKHNGLDYTFRKKHFINPEWNLKAFEGSKCNMIADDFQRGLSCFIRPVKRCATGHFASAQDRANYKFNQKLKKAIMENDTKTLTEIGEEYVEILKKLPEPKEPVLIDESSMHRGEVAITDRDLLMDTESYEERRAHELNTFSVVVPVGTSASVNDKDSFANRYKGLADALIKLQKEKPDDFKLLVAKVNTKYTTYLDTFYTTKGRTYNKQFLSEDERRQYNALKPGALEKWMDGYYEYISLRDGKKVERPYKKIIPR